MFPGLLSESRLAEDISSKDINEQGYSVHGTYVLRKYKYGGSC